MASIVPKPPPFSFPATLNSNQIPTVKQLHTVKFCQLLPHAVDEENSQDSAAASATKEAEPPSAPTGVDDSSFENRLNQVRLKYRSGTGKKAEQRRARKSGTGSSSSSSKKKVLLPPVPLKEPVSADGLVVEAGFTPYSERLNGRLAGIGLAALLLVELYSGKSVLKYHTPAILFIQIYTVAAAAALFMKFEKERASIWPQKSSSSTSNSSRR